jgi:hypothetical protein
MRLVPADEWHTHAAGSADRVVGIGYQVARVRYLYRLIARCERRGPDTVSRKSSGSIQASEVLAKAREHGGNCTTFDLDGFLQAG